MSSVVVSDDLQKNPASRAMPSVIVAATRSSVEVGTPKSLRDQCLKRGNAMNRIAGFVFLVGLTTLAQVVDKKALTLDGAKKVLAAAEAEAAKNRVGCNIAVVDDGGNLVAFHRVDPTFPAGARVSIGKARTAALFRQPTKNFEEVITQKGRTSMIALDDFTPLQGGVPIAVAGQIVGAIGVSGASSADQDEQFARAGAAALK